MHSISASVCQLETSLSHPLICWQTGRHIGNELFFKVRVQESIEKILSDKLDGKC